MRYSVVLIGPRGSGKTVFLASMYRRLSVPGEFGFYLNTGQSQRKALVALYSAIATGDDWPPGTAEISEWQFQCNVLSRAKHYTAFDLVYYDYSGGRITEVGADDPKFEDAVNQADCLLGLLDGHKILAFMTDSDNSFSLVDLPNMLAILNQSKSPVHLVVSKWDLLQDHYSLENVRDKLLTDKQFNAFVHSQNRNGQPLRLIPVSSVGKGFATWENGRMIKHRGKLPDPFQVEMPMALVLPDRVEQALRRLVLEEEERQRLATNIRVAPNLTLAQKFGLYLGRGLRTVREYLPPRLSMTDSIIEQIAKRVEHSGLRQQANAENEASRRRCELAGILENVRDEKSALEYAMNTFEELEKRLTHTFPASRLLLPEWFA